ncbi:ABC-2 type transport system permease protein [Thalassospira sp. MBR-102]|uniref:Transport permease protein n=3 Tax=Thalassospira TaxID=168934 RepID=A0A154L7A6_9PROT|nr:MULTISPECIES: ABC transporter permease [Thalassospira]MBR9779451.1 ABC transporter permease [Rhodospirillales bacterium]PTB84054.1 multidrug ABC transporter permease [Marinobacter vinifirmus]UKV14738.1 ABC transporter permease [Thalassospiraceae bacterium SW-3-3]KZB66587.1 multidrug ABC transporter permease [Thalassospira lucentensis]KZD01338.1 multidrug ABC transporter permease [Thalassospira xiamenensis]
MQELAPRQMGAINWLGLWTLYAKEVRRFLNVHLQTIGAPVVTSLLFMAVFLLALGRAVETVNGVPFATFLAPGLVMMTMAQNAFANTSSSIIISKVQGNIVDVLMPPLSAGEMVAGFAFGAVTRGIMVGVATTIVMAFFVDVGIHNIWAILYFGISASLMLSLLGIAGGVWSEKFDHIAVVTNFVITPLSFLSGTFYSAENLPEAGKVLVHYNPFFYMIDGFRYGFTGVSDGTVMTGVVVLAVVNVLLWILCYRMIKSGYKLKA